MASKVSKVDLGLLVLRFFPAALMITHGWGKLVKFSEMRSSFPDPLGIGSFASLTGTVGAEFFCAVLVLLGIATRLAAVPLAFTMCVAAFIVHGNDPLQNKELALVYLFIFIALIFTGGGKYSVGSKLPKLRKFN